MTALRHAAEFGVWLFAAVIYLLFVYVLARAAINTVIYRWRRRRVSQEFRAMERDMLIDAERRRLSAVMQQGRR